MATATVALTLYGDTGGRGGKGEGKSVYELGQEKQFGSAFCNETAELSQAQESIPVFLYLLYIKCRYIINHT